MKKLVDRRTTCIVKQGVDVEKLYLSFLKIYNDKFHRVRIIIDSSIHIKCTMQWKYKSSLDINKILYVSNEKRSTSIETIASMSHMSAPDLIELHRMPKKFSFFLTMKYISDHFQKNTHCNLECEHDIEKKWWLFEK